MDTFLFSKEKIEWVNRWTLSARRMEMSVMQWATLIALVLIDEKIYRLGSRRVVDKSKWPELVAAISLLNWLQPFATTTHREGRSGSHEFMDWVESDRLSYEQKEKFTKGVNYILQVCYERIVHSNTEYDWLLHEVCNLCWNNYVSFNPRVVEKIVLESKVSTRTRAGLLDFYSYDKTSRLPFHLRLRKEFWQSLVPYVRKVPRFAPHIIEHRGVSSLGEMGAMLSMIPDRYYNPAEDTLMALPGFLEIIPKYLRIRLSARSDELQDLKDQYSQFGNYGKKYLTNILPVIG